MEVFMIPAPAPVSPDPSSGGRLVSTDGQLLPLVSARLIATAQGGVAEVVLEQRFRNAGTIPLAVTYSFPLPADAAVGGYAFTIGDRRIVGEIDRRQAARERFEQALIEGRTAGLVEQERSSLFTQELGNIPPGADVVAELTLDQRLRWLDEGAWEWRFPTTAAPRYLGPEGRVADAARISQDVSGDPLPARLTLALKINDAFTAVPESPSHRVRASEGAVRFDDDAGVPLDRDLVVRWPVARAAAGLALEVARPQGAQAYGLLTLTPPARTTPSPSLPRDLIVLLDTSGSMDGQPLEQARKVVSALVDTLGDADRLELIEFSSAPRRWKAEPVAATAAMRREALAWLGKLRASGGTEMRAGILEALRPLRAESQRQIVLVTDGLIGFEQEVVGAIVKGLPASSRVHTVGVGSAVNRSLTMAAARAGRGLEVMTGLAEDVERAARRLVARTDAPLVVDLSVSGPALVAHAPAALPDLFAGAPALISLELRPEGGTLAVRGRTVTGEWQQTIDVPARAPGEGSRATVRLFGRERIEDLETRVAAGEDHDGEIERLGLAFQVATRLTSWIAVSEEVTVDPGAPTRRVRMPQELPHGMSVEGLGLRGGPPAFAGGAMRTRMAMTAMPMTVGPRAEAPRGPAQPGFLSRAAGFLGKAFGGAASDDEGTDLAQADQDAPEFDRLFRGRVTLRKDDKLVLHFVVEDGDLDWAPGTEVELVLGDGRRLMVRVLENISTRAATIRSGEEVRLIIELAPDQPLPARVVIAGPVRISIEL
jgi:Ca-activated chloride channel family protein